MKTLKTIIFASAALIATVACTKEANPKESVPSAPGTIEVNVTALIGDLAPSEGTKATMAPVIRLTWENTDKVYAYDAEKYLGDLTVTPASDGLSAKLTGTLTNTPAEGTKKITLVYCNTADTAPTIDGSTGKITFDLGTQDEAANPFVVYATLDYSAGQTSITDKIVPFKFATSLMRVTVTGIANAYINTATVSGVNTACELTVNKDAAPAVAGTTPSNISRTGTDSFTRSDGRAVFNVSVAAEATTNDNRTLSINQGNLIYGSKLMSGAIAAGTSIISVYALTEQTGSRGTINGHDYVYVAGKKWATQNLAITTSGNKEWKPGGSTVTVPGSSSKNVVVGDYFQWGAYPGYCGDATAADQGLLIYSSFTNMKCGDSKSKFTFKKDSGSTDYNFSTSSISPYYSSSPYTRYNNSDKAYRPNLDISDDVARTLWGDTWRMPTKEEFQTLYGATKWTWKDNGCYVTKLGEDLAGDNSNALLFFPAAGASINDILNFAGTYGYYWSSTLYSDNTDRAYDLYFLSGNVNPQDHGNGRYSGFSVRPLSD